MQLLSLPLKLVRTVLRNSSAQNWETTSCTDENGVQNLYALVHGSTGMPVDYGSQFNQLDEDVKYYGPFALEGPVAIAFDMARRSLFNTTRVAWSRQ